MFTEFNNNKTGVVNGSVLIPFDIDVSKDVLNLLIFSIIKEGEK